MSVTILKDGAMVTVSDDEFALLNPPSTNPMPIPASISRLQGRLALNAAGLLTQVEAAVASSGMATQIWYADAQHWERDNPIIAGLATKIGLTSAQLDDLFTKAGTF